MVSTFISDASNLRRTLIEKDSYPIPPIFTLMAKKGNIEEQMMYNTYNMGIGMIVAVDPADVDKTMEAMRAVVLVTCVISILSGVLDALKPNSQFDRQLRLLLSAVFVLGILTPLSQGAAAFQPDWEPDTETAAVELEAAAAQATQKQAAANLEESLEAMLRQHGIADAQAEVEMYISGDNCIEIEQVTVYCTDPAAAEPLLTDCLGKEVKIHVETAS